MTGCQSDRPFGIARSIRIAVFALAVLIPASVGANEDPAEASTTKGKGAIAHAAVRTIGELTEITVRLEPLPGLKISSELGVKATVEDAERGQVIGDHEVINRVQGQDYFSVPPTLTVKFGTESGHLEAVIHLDYGYCTESDMCFLDRISLPIVTR